MVAGARVAWRNAPKCANRKFAMELQLLDKRDVVDAQVQLLLETSVSLWPGHPQQEAV